jgi:pimeloyl-ACP methyl ester carboxylesterase
MLESHTVDLNGVQLHYAEAPGSGPALVIVHGLTGSHAEFLHLVPELARQAHVYVLDLRGHGRSGRAESGYQVADYGRDVAAFLQQVVGQPAVLMGHSLGSMVAVWLAVKARHLLRGIFLEDPPFYVLQMPRFNQTHFYP